MPLEYSNWEKFLSILPDYNSRCATGFSNTLAVAVIIKQSDRLFIGSLTQS